MVVVFVSGFSFVNFVMSNVEFAKTVFNTQMKSLLLDSFSANITHIVVYLKNTGKQTVEITQAYVNSMLTMLQDGKAIIQPLSVGVATIVGSFAEGDTYTVKLSNIFNTAVTFTVTLISFL